MESTTVAMTHPREARPRLVRRSPPTNSNFDGTKLPMVPEEVQTTAYGIGLRFPALLAQPESRRSGRDPSQGSTFDHLSVHAPRSYNCVATIKSQFFSS